MARLTVHSGEIALYLAGEDIETLMQAVHWFSMWAPSKEPHITTLKRLDEWRDLVRKANECKAPICAVNEDLEELDNSLDRTLELLGNCVAEDEVQAVEGRQDDTVGDNHQSAAGAD